MAWFAKGQAAEIVSRAHHRMGAGWSFLAKAMKEAIVAREVALFLAEQPSTDGFLRLQEISDLFEASYELAGLRKAKRKPGVRAQDRLLGARARG